MRSTINLNNINRSLSGLSDSVKSATQKSDQISDNIKDRNLSKKKLAPRTLSNWEFFMHNLIW